MSKEISAIHSSLKSIKIKEKRPLNINKILTFIMFFGILTVGLVYLLAGRSEITGKVTVTLNNCNFENTGNPLASGSFYCFHEYKNENLVLNLKYSVPYEKEPVTITNIKLDSCSISPNLLMYPGKIYTFEIPCDNIGIREEVILSFINKDSGIEHNLKGQITNLI